MTRVSNQIGKCPDGPNSSFIPCLNNALYNATCNTDPANIFSGSNVDGLNKGLVIVVMVVYSVLF